MTEYLVKLLKLLAEQLCAEGRVVASDLLRDVIERLEKQEALLAAQAEIIANPRRKAGR